MSDIIVCAHNIRSTHNIGSIFRTCEGFGISRLVLSGYTPYPSIPNDSRLPHIADKLTSQIQKTALGAERLVPFEYRQDLLLTDYKDAGYQIVGLEQDNRSIMIQEFKPDDKIVLILGEEVHGLTPQIRAQCDALLEIPMSGKKESFNVSVATGIALYALRHSS